MTPGEQSAALYGPPTKPRDEAKPETVRIAPFTAEPAIPHETIRERQRWREIFDLIIRSLSQIQRAALFEAVDAWRANDE